jgi:hypothetical protein
MIIDFRNVDMGKPFRFLGGPYDGERGITVDYIETTWDGDVIDHLADMKRGHRELGLYDTLTFVPETVYKNMAAA